MIESTHVYEPRGPHRTSLEDPQLTIADATGTLLVHFCTKHQVGAIYDLDARAWTMFSPMSPQEFIGALPKLGVRIGDTSELQRWIDSISATSAPRPN